LWRSLNIVAASGQWPVARYIKRFGVHPVHGGKLEVKDLVPLWGCRDWVPTGGSVRVQFLGKESMGIIYLMGIYIYIQWGFHPQCDGQNIIRL
jgi:hypothetical protein